ncbi:MAG: hypothetical protein ACI837_000407, partial [Crocinitomicaceae bacterium]
MPLNHQLEKLEDDKITFDCNLPWHFSALICSSR